MKDNYPYLLLSLVFHLSLLFTYNINLLKIDLNQKATQEISVILLNSIQKAVPLQSNPKVKNHINETSLTKNKPQQKLDKTSDGKSILAEYLTKIHQKLNQAKSYPQQAQRMEIEGTVIATFEINKLGKLIRIHSIKGNHPLLENAVRKIFDSIGDFSPFPNELIQEHLTITLPLKYALSQI